MEPRVAVHGLYLYCLAWSSRLGDLEGVGLNGQQPPLLTRVGDLAVIWSPVRLAEFCGEDAAARLRDVLWVAPRACRHEAVVENVIRRSPVLPVGFGSIFSSWSRLEQVLHVHREAIAQFLTRVADQEEWAVKVLLDRTRAQQEFSSQKLAIEAERLALLSPGRRYFEEQLLRSEADQELGRWFQAVCGLLVLDLRGLAADWCKRHVLPVNGENQDDAVVLNWAFLVPKEAVVDFKARIKAANTLYGQHGLVFACTGPWPPYTFSPSLTTESSR
jgi:hypothetical protein